MAIAEYIRSLPDDLTDTEVSHLVFHRFGFATVPRSCCVCDKAFGPGAQVVVRGEVSADSEGIALITQAAHPDCGMGVLYVGKAPVR
jgi:hypothetical protein